MTDCAALACTTRQTRHGTAPTVNQHLAQSQTHMHMHMHMHTHMHMHIHADTDMETMSKERPYIPRSP